MKHLKSLSYMIAQLAVDLLIITGSLFLGYIIRLAADEKSSSLASYAPAFFMARATGGRTAMLLTIDSVGV